MLLLIVSLCALHIFSVKAAKCDLFPDLPECTTTSSTTTTTVPPQPSSPAPTLPPPIVVDPSNEKVTFGFLFDGTDQLNVFKSALTSASQTFVSLLSQDETSRVDGYILLLYRDTSDITIQSTPDSTVFFQYLSSYGSSNGFSVPKCMAANPTRVLIQALARSTPRCVLYWVVGANTVSIDNNILDSLMISLTERQCRVDIVLYDIGCFDENLSTFTIFQTIADVTGGTVYVIGSAVKIDDVASIWAIQQTSPKVDLNKGHRPAGLYIERIAVDSTLVDLTVLVQGCNLKADIRDNRGVLLSTDANGAYQSQIASSDQLIYLLIQLTATQDLSNPGPGQWLFNASSTCPLYFEISGTAPQLVRYAFSPFLTNNADTDLAVPLMGLKERVKLYNVGSESDTTIFPTYLEYVDIQGNPFDGSLLTGPPLLITQQYLTAGNAVFYIKIVGLDENGYLFQRYSYAPYYARGLNPAVNLPQTGQCAGKFDCSGYGDKCVDFSALGDCDPTCPNGADEACMRGYTKCDCHCIPFGSTCRTFSPGSSCTDRYGLSYFQCVNDGSCILSSFVGDSVRDCDDFSDENPTYFNECNSPSGSNTADWCAVGSTCTKISGGSFYCSCPQGQWGDGFKCYSVPPPPPPPVTSPPSSAVPIGPTIPHTPAPPVITIVVITAPTTPVPTPSKAPSQISTGAAVATTAPTVVQSTPALIPLPQTTLPPAIVPANTPTTGMLAPPPSTASGSQVTAAVIVPPATLASAAPVTIPANTPTTGTLAPPPSTASGSQVTAAVTIPPATLASAAPMTLPTIAINPVTGPQTIITPASTVAIPATVPPTTAPPVLAPITTASPAPFLPPTTAAGPAPTQPSISTQPTATPVASLPPATTAGLITTKWQGSVITSMMPIMMSTITSVRIIDPLTAAFTSPRCPGQFDCGLNSSTCLPISNFHDCKYDCPNLLDETCFQGYAQCDLCKCVLFSDYSIMCLDWKSTKICESIPGMYVCHDGISCIYQTWIMDGAFDCNDGSDENPLYWDECALGLDNCDKNSMICRDNATVPLTPDGRFVCKCKPNFYTIDGGKTCKPI